MEEVASIPLPLIDENAIFRKGPFLPSAVVTGSPHLDAACLGNRASTSGDVDRLKLKLIATSADHFLSAFFLGSELEANRIVELDAGQTTSNDCVSKFLGYHLSCKRLLNVI